MRIKLGAGQRIEDKDKEVIGIHVSAKTIKNKVAPPFRSINFEIHFGKGIVEHEQVFDLLRKHGEQEIDGKLLKVSGTGTWKVLTITDNETGEIVTEKKFYKSDFDKVMADPEYTGYVEALLKHVLVKKMTSEFSSEIDHESYEEVRSIALDVEEELGDFKP